MEALKFASPANGATITHEDVIISVRSINPLQAAAILDIRNGSNRPLSPIRVKEYTEAMKNNQWLFNGDAIRFSNDLTLADGQHRLQAVVNSNTTQDFIVVENTEKRARLTMDTGRIRSGGDALVIEAGVGQKTGAAINRALVLLKLYEDGRSLADGGSTRMSNAGVIEHYKKHKERVDGALVFLQDNLPGRGQLLSKAEALYLLLVLREIDTQQAEEFIVSTMTGVGITGEGALSYLRNYLIGCKTKTIGYRGSDKLASVIKAWNAIRKGRKVSRIPQIRFDRTKEDAIVAI